MVAGVGVASASPRGGRVEHSSQVSRGGGGYHGGGEVRSGGYRGGGVVRGGGYARGGERVYGGRGYERGYGGNHYREYGARPGWRYSEHFAYRAGYDWVGGDWYWDGAEWVWAPGHYVHLRVW